jgi:biotin carboxyl carrier protein
MPATVIEILVEPGQSVRQGDVLVKLEAMKMELPLRAPQDGRVKHVRCTPGELVQPGVPLLEMEEAEGSGLKARGS